jgi:phage-related holin
LFLNLSGILLGRNFSLPVIGILKRVMYFNFVIILSKSVDLLINQLDFILEAKTFFFKVRTKFA